MTLSSAGCMFDVVHVHQAPAAFSPLGKAPDSFRLIEPVKVSIGTGFATRLNGNTTWHEIGRIKAGIVYNTADQVVAVEASNIYEARIVVADHVLVGFYLPVEQTFVAVSPPLPLQTLALPQPNNP